MSESLHGMTLAHKISDCVLIVPFNLEDLYCYRALPPCGFVYYSIASFRNLLVKFELLKRNLQGCIKCSSIYGSDDIEFALFICLDFDALFILTAK